MTRYRYEAYGKSAAIEVGDIEAASVADALKRLNEQGLIPIKAEPTSVPSAAPKGTSFFSPRRLTLKDYAEFTNELAVLLRAELPLDQALRLLVTTAGQPHTKALTEQLLQSVVAGQPLSAAMRENAPAAPIYVSSLIRAGEARGALAPTLTDLARFIQVRVEIQEKLRSAFTYPMILAVTALAAIGVILTVLVPALLPLFGKTGAPLPMGLSVASAISVWLKAYWQVLIIGICGLILVAKVLAHREAIQILKDRITLRLPLIGPLIRKTSVAIFARTLGTLLRNGVALMPALQIAATAVPNRSIQAVVTRAAADVNEGKRLAKALERSGEFPPLALRFVAIGEDASKLDEMLLHLAEISEKDAHKQTDHLMVMLVPIMTVAIGITVGALILSVMDAILAANEVALR